MIAFRHILCPIDFSETSMRALAYAAALASGYEAQLEVLHVVPASVDDMTKPPSDVNSRPLSLDADVQNEITDQIRRAITATGVPSVNAIPVVQEGRAHEVIVSRAQEQQADLLVMGTHGRGGFTRLLLGSVTEKVLQTAPCPVLTVPPGASPITGVPPTFNRILCPVDFSPSARKALRYALELGRQTKGRLTVLYALEYAEPEENLELSPFDPCYPASVENRRRRQQLTDYARQRLHALISEESSTGCEIDEVVVNDRAYKAILRQATDASADLMIWLQFALTALVIVLAGVRLARYGDVLGEKTGLGRSWIGWFCSPQPRVSPSSSRDSVPPHLPPYRTSHSGTSWAAACSTC